MRSTTSGRRALVLAALATGSLALSACSAGSLGSSDGDGDGADGGGSTEITFLTNNDPTNVETAEAVIKAFEAENDDITVKIDTRPGGGDGDNLVKTRLSTGDMAEVFEYNNGSLLQAIKPEQNLSPRWTTSPGRPTSTRPSDVVTGRRQALRRARRAPPSAAVCSTTSRVYEKLGLEVPKTWDEFMANNEKIKAAGRSPRSSRPTATPGPRSCFVLGDYHNVEAADPDFAAKYTANEAKYATTPAALAGFQHIQEVQDAGYLNKDFASAKLNDGLEAVATGTAAHYPMLAVGVAAIVQTSRPSKTDDVGFFALPGDDACDERHDRLARTSALYIPKSAEGDKLDAAKKFIAFAATPEGCDARPRRRRRRVRSCRRPARCRTTCRRSPRTPRPTSTTGKASPALEFKSPIKGPSLEQICLQVGTGQVAPRRAPSCTTRT